MLFGVCVGVCVALLHQGGVRYFSNERGLSVEFSVQGISSDSLLWKRNNSSVVTKT